MSWIGALLSFGLEVARSSRRDLATETLRHYKRKLRRRRELHEMSLAQKHMDFTTCTVCLGQDLDCENCSGLGMYEGW